jgi:hypothetical protein
MRTDLVTKGLLLLIAAGLGGRCKPAVGAGGAAGVHGEGGAANDR